MGPHQGVEFRGQGQDFSEPPPPNPASRRRKTRGTVRYAFDEQHRLLVMDARDALQPTRILEGRLSTDERNRLTYLVRSSQQADRRPALHTMRFDGTWSLTTNHELTFAWHEATTRERHTVALKGTIAKVDGHTLVFSVRRHEEPTSQTAQRVTLMGRWQADARNRLTFLVEKADGTGDRLTFQGGWHVGPHHELLYRYRQHGPTGSPRAEQTLVFEGAWDVTKANRLIYRLAGSADSAFEFSASLQSPSLFAREGRLTYQVGVRLARGITHRQRVTLFGTWKLHQDLAVSFEIPYADGRVQAIRFVGALSLTSRDRIAVVLHTRQGEQVGLTVLFTRELVPDVSLFLRVRKEAKERSAIGGLQVRF